MVRLHGSPARIARADTTLINRCALRLSLIHIFVGQIQELETRIRELAGGEEFNLSSPMQLSRILFDKLGLPTAGLKKTQRGYYSTNAKVLEDLAKDHEIVRFILEFREKTKIKSTYLDTLGPLRRNDGRVHQRYSPPPASYPRRARPR